MALHETQNHVTIRLLLLLLIAITLTAALSSSNTSNMAPPTAKRGCQDRCGSVTIPYPFGTSLGCSYNESFLIACNDTKPFMPHSNVSLVGILVADGELRVRSTVSRACYDKRGKFMKNASNYYVSTITNSIFPLSTRNDFITVGCNTIGLVGGYRGRYFGTGCVAYCNKTADVINGSCSVGCCGFPIPQGVFDYATSVENIANNRTKDVVQAFNPCVFAFVVERGRFNFSSSDLHNLRNRKTFPVAFHWAVGDHATCREASKNRTGYACVASNSRCVNSTNGPGYRCTCSQGFHGNPYLPHGCLDVNECEEYPKPCNTTCVNLPGSFRCLCANGYGGDGLRNGSGCVPSHARSNQSARNLSIALGLCIGLLAFLVGNSWIYWALKKRKLILLKQKFFQQNGGLLLSQRGSADTPSMMVFTTDELNKATDNFHDTRVIGRGGHGTVYKGVLDDCTVVAIKKSKMGDRSQVEQFINEVTVLSQINHRNVVKLLGCCLETEVPLLVYEFITNGTLFDRIRDSSLSPETCLKIAAETAGAIAYLHSSASMPIIHRDIKTTNILLDEDYVAKVSDFGASRLVPLDKAQLTTLVQGTLGYLDPEYFQSSLLTEKSDVYSFGVVLAELLTGEAAMCFSRPESHRNLAMFFVSAMKADRLIEILDERMVGEEAELERLEAVADIARRCLRLRGEERPSMKQVASELEGLVRRSTATHPWSTCVEHDDDLLNSEEAEYLLGTSDPVNGGGCSYTVSGSSVEILKPCDDGR